MKRLLIPLLTAIALPTAVNAETYSLMVFEIKNNSNKPSVFEEITNITFSTKEACIEEGEKFKNRLDEFWGYHCFKGNK